MYQLQQNHRIRTDISLKHQGVGELGAFTIAKS